MQMLPNMPWRYGNRADPEVRVLADRHYSRQSPGSMQFVPPGRCLVLKVAQAYWVTSWPYPEFVKHAWPGAWICSAFRREAECPYLASDLVRSAVAATCAHWGQPPALGMITFVDTTKVRHKRDWGRCFRKAGFKPLIECTKGGLFVLQMLPEWMPKPQYAHPMAPLAQQLLEMGYAR